MISSTTQISQFQTPLIVPRQNQDKRVATAFNLLNAYQEGIYLVHKTTRAGCTTALVAESINRREQFLVVVPTNKIADQTVIEDSIKYSDRDDCNVIHIPSNHACLKNQELCEQYPDLSKLPILPLAEKCSDCENFVSCPVTRILHEGKSCDGVAVTYQKIVALMMASSSRPNTTAESVIDTISKVHNVMFDEVHEVQYGKSTSITIYNDAKKERRFNDGKYISVMDDYEHIRKIVVAFSMLIDEQSVGSAILQTYNNALDEKYYLHKLSKTIKNSYSDVGGDDQTKFIMAVYSEIINLTRDRKKYNLSMHDVLDLYKIMNMVMSEQVVIHGIREKGHVKIQMVSVDQMFTRVLKSFIMSIQNKAKRTLLTSATICSHDYDQYFMGDTGPKNITFGAGGDPMNTNAKMLILADSKKYGATGRNSRYKKKEEILQKITTLLDLYGDDDCIIIALSIVEALELQKDLEAIGHPHQVTYYKAPEMMGVSAKARVMIAVGVADKPSNAFDAIRDTKEESLVLREEAVHCDTWQAWSRVKDPAGKVPSLVFALGCSSEACENVTTWGYDRRVLVTRGGNRREVEVVTDKSVITFPNITKCKGFDEMLSVANSHKPYKNVLDKSKTNLTFGKKVPIYYIIGTNQPKVRLVLDCSRSDLIKNHLVNRFDTFAEQTFDGRYARRSIPLMDSMIQSHLDGKMTIGAYSTSENGTCKWICYDVDAHAKEGDSVEDIVAKENKAEDDLKKLTSFLNGVGLKYLVESSGSPHSYHIWLFVEEVEVEKAYYFANLIAKEAGFDGEVNPKQRTWNKDNQYGNLVKLPFAFHKRHKVFSHIHGWEGETHNIHVYDISNIEIPKTRTRRTSGVKTVNIKINGIRPCIQSALEKELTGSQGNMMRVAVVREYYNFGMTDREQLIDLFRGQDDFDYNETAYHVDKIIEVERRVWPHTTLVEKCSKFLNCDECDRYDCKGCA